MTVYEHVANSVLQSLNGELPEWRRPWRQMRAQGLSTLPINADTGRAYRGINAFLLWKRGDKDMRYLTFRQAQRLGGHVRKGEHGTGIVFWKSQQHTAKDLTTGEEKSKRSLLLRYFTVFNITQCEGLELPPVTPVAIPPRMENIYRQLDARVEHGGNEAFYAEGLDLVALPVPEAFSCEDAYSTTAFHEIGHWTSHPTRLNRTFNAHKSSENYALEELVAEFCSTYLDAYFGIDMMLEHHASYIQHWRRLCTDQPRALLTCASRAQAAADYILQRVGAAIESICSDAQSEELEAAET